MRFYLIDKVTQIVPGELARGIKNISLSDDVFDEHFPGIPVFPGCFLVESMAQLGGFLAEVTHNTSDTIVRRAVLAQIEKAKFREPVRPGDQIEVTATLESRLNDSYQITGVGNVNGKKVVDARMTFLMWEVDLEQIHQSRRELYKIWTRGMELNFTIR